MYCSYVHVGLVAIGSVAIVNVALKEGNCCSHSCMFTCNGLCTCIISSYVPLYNILCMYMISVHWKCVGAVETCLATSKNVKIIHFH